VRVLSRLLWRAKAVVGEQAALGRKAFRSRTPERWAGWSSDMLLWLKTAITTVMLRDRHNLTAR